jgi:uncharacterized integral membrane protein
MSLNRTTREGGGQAPPADVGTSAAAEQLTPPQPAQTATASPGQVPRTRTGTAWVALIAAALLAVLLIVFLVQNTHSTEISFLWMTTSTPLAIALLIAAVGSVLLILIVGTARISQLRRLVRKNRTR